MNNNIGQFQSGIKSNINFGGNARDFSRWILNGQRNQLQELLKKKAESNSPLNISHEKMGDCFGLNTDPIFQKHGKTTEKAKLDTFEITKTEK
ncbi:MAG: hypothetical protein PHC34_02205 [Candidatus Gastranaerophilales bacterium]|nr:hypothetical protein [Candidatus Gastranaerophilales bacterium]